MDISAPRAFSLDAGPSTPAQRSDRLMQAAEGFEALFLTQVMQTARAASLGDGLLEGTGMDTTNSMLDQALGEAGAGRSGFGLAQAIYRQLSPTGDPA